MGFYYTIVTREQALQSDLFETTWTTNAYLQIEHKIKAVCIPASKVDLLSGDRVYRIHDTHIKRLKIDGLEVPYIPTRLGNYYFTTTDPTVGQAKKHDTWLPMGP